MPYKDKTKQLNYMRVYMRQRRALERKLIHELRINFPEVDAKIRKQFGIKPSKFGHNRKRKRRKKK